MEFRGLRVCSVGLRLALHIKCFEALTEESGDEMGGASGLGEEME